MQLGWNEIKQRAVHFSREWAGETRENAEAKSFWDAFFNVFGIPRRSVASFEEPVRKLNNQYGYIDLFWKGRLLVEHKSLGKSLDQAESQAFDYLQSLAREGRHDEIPRYVIVTDFDRLALYDLEPDDVRDLPLFCGMHVQRVEIRVKELHRHIRLFGFIPGYKIRTFEHEDPINIKAAEVMGQLHDATIYDFGILTSSMHMAWMRQVCGRLESRYRYSAGLVYNNFPWPQIDVAQSGEVTPCTDADSVREAAARAYWTSYHEGNEEEEAKARERHKAGLLKGDAKKVAAVEAKAQAVLDVREKYPRSTLADLYDPLTMPADLVKAHADLDRAVDRCYRTAPFTSDRQRVEFLFSLYESLTAPLLPVVKKGRKRKA